MSTLNPFGLNPDTGELRLIKSPDTLPADILPNSDYRSRYHAGSDQAFSSSGDLDLSVYSEGIGDTSNVGSTSIELGPGVWLLNFAASGYAEGNSNASLQLIRSDDSLALSLQYVFGVAAAVNGPLNASGFARVIVADEDTDTFKLRAEVAAGTIHVLTAILLASKIG